MHCRFMAPGASHVQWCPFGSDIMPSNTQSFHYTLPISIKQHPDHLMLSRPFITGTISFHYCCTASWVVTCCNVQWGEAILGANIWVCMVEVVCVCVCVCVCLYVCACVSGNIVENVRNRNNIICKDHIYRIISELLLCIFPCIIQAAT